MLKPLTEETNAMPFRSLTAVRLDASCLRDLTVILEAEEGALGLTGAICG
ncbi:MAG: hypothetical protein ACYCSW_11345 [bacterium]